MEPKIVSIPAFRVVGISYLGKNVNDEIALLWRENQELLKDIPPKVGAEGFLGIMRNIDEDSGCFEYLAGIEVAEDADLSGELVCWEIPDQTYAVCKCTLANLGEAFQRLQNDWLAKSDYERADGAEFERYDEVFHFGDPVATIHIYVPIQASW